MKTNTPAMSKLFATAMLISTLFSCKKDASISASTKSEASPQEFAQVVSDVSNLNTDQIREDQAVDAAISNDLKGVTTLTTYPIITYNPSKTALARTITVDWGNGNAGPDGIIRYGQVVTQYTGNSGRDVGDKTIRTYVNYKTKNATLLVAYQGAQTITVTQKGNAAGTVLNITKVDDQLARTITLLSNKNIYIFSTEGTRVVKTNLSTKDQVWTGSESGKREPAGQTKYFQWKSTFTDLAKPGAYAYIVSGIRTDKYAFIDGGLNASSYDNVVTNYGKGAWDQDAVVSYKGKDFNVLLPLDPYKTYNVIK
jgi:hypothetical protein